MTLCFSKQERLTSKIQFAELVEQGAAIRQGPIRLKCVPSTIEGQVLQVAFTVPKRNVRKAVDRNRIKRQMRESFRHLKADLYEHIQGRSIQASFLFVYLGKEPMPSETIRSTMLRLVERWIKENARVDQ